MLVNMKEMLSHAQRDGYAVMAVNSVNMEMARAVIEAAEEEHSPVIVQMTRIQMKALAHPEDLVPMVLAMARRSSVPVCLNLDHGPDYATVVDTLRRGFTNVMIDASSLPFEENIRRTRIVTDTAHAMGASVEAELGHVGQAVSGDGKTADFYTNVEQAVEFVRRTEVDALAVAVGTAHGKYPADYVPKLDFKRLAELREPRRGRRMLRNKAADGALGAGGGTETGDRIRRHAIFIAPFLRIGARFDDRMKVPAKIERIRRDIGDGLRDIDLCDPCPRKGARFDPLEAFRQVHGHIRKRHVLERSLLDHDSAGRQVEFRQGRHLRAQQERQYEQHRQFERISHVRIPHITMIIAHRYNKRYRILPTVFIACRPFNVNKIVFGNTEISLDLMFPNTKSISSGYLIQCNDEPRERCKSGSKWPQGGVIVKRYILAQEKRHRREPWMQIKL